MTVPLSGNPLHREGSYNDPAGSRALKFLTVYMECVRSLALGRAYDTETKSPGHLCLH